MIEGFLQKYQFQPTLMNSVSFNILIQYRYRSRDEHLHDLFRKKIFYIGSEIHFKPA